ncbi:hypothetical protein CHLRE_12g558650v5 [Chlamydomonas reinhardtii]|uniref:Translation initiation factor eIF2B subunit delta n=1 Tax=Chlamydomonas reinhardtii TaxID=3055 RepID=A0A2K3D5N4_CHLRE|nr:uncharacterized protein CHLRE_12g558650v5 [Chlamydomonas reinhardtii]PNW75836.1 hypothetical protein CHLRE_12g558650v5 [Chlamydomonas reinhardtii]
MTGPQQAPAKQVVGFHVEGASPSPTAPSLLNTMTAGSPTPVIIPPTFQREASHGSRSQGIADAAARALEVGAATSTSTAQAAPEASGATGSRTAAAPPSTSAPRPIHAAEKAEASHAGLVKMVSQASVGSEASVSTASAGMFSIDTSTVRQTPSPQPSPFAGHSKQPADGAADKGAASGAAGSAGASGPPDGAKGPKPQREMTKAERRALQESQRAAKAAQKAGSGAPAPPAAKGGAGGADAARASKGGGAAGGAAEPRPSGGKPAAAAGGAAPRADGDRRVDSAGGAGAAGGAGGAGNAASAAASAGAGGAGGADGGAAPKKKKDPKAVSLNSTELFAHLQQFKRINVGNLLQLPAAANIHPAILQLGLRYADGSIRGANARCLAMLNAFCQMIRDYSTPDGKELSRDLLRHLSEHVAFLVVCRPLSVGMGNAIRHLKLRISTIPPDMPEAEAKELLEQEIADYVNVRIDSADKQLVGYAVAKVEQHGDVILTYAASHVVCRALTEAARAGKSFRVVVMDSRPEAEGRATLGRLLAAGIPCTYVDLNAASYIIREVTKVFLGAAAVLSNGTVLSRAGTAAVAMMAHAHNKPVMICCETHKFNERVQLDSITHNELGDPEALAAVPGKPEMNALEGWRDNPRLRLLNLKYDVMPAEYVTMVVTEFGMVPPTSVPVILREFRQSETTVSGPF